MRFPKTLTVCCLLAGMTASLTIAQDSDAQQKALDALRQYTAEKEGRTSKGLTTAPATDSESAAKKELENKARESVRQQPQQQQQQAPATTQATGNSDQDRKAREALDELRRANDAPVAPAPQSTAVVTTAPNDDKEAAARAALEASYSSAPRDNTIAPNLEQQARKELEVMAAQPTSTAQSSVAAGQPVVMEKPKPTTKKEKLDALLDQYMDNAITPREYHEQRAMIIAGK